MRLASAQELQATPLSGRCSPNCTQGLIIVDIVYLAAEELLVEFEDTRLVRGISCIDLYVLFLNCQEDQQLLHYRYASLDISINNIDSTNSFSQQRR
ncbi:hypothetical protein BS78_07G164200 [Paspalum vaginatum]|nr:hypothetical protein BS78_07G164200 [Paspalum vaginatum]